MALLPGRAQAQALDPDLAASHHWAGRLKQAPAWAVQPGALDLQEWQLLHVMSQHVQKPAAARHCLGQGQGGAACWRVGHPLPSMSGHGGLLWARELAGLGRSGHACKLQLLLPCHESQGGMEVAGGGMPRCVSAQNRSPAGPVAPCRHVCAAAGTLVLGRRPGHRQCCRVKAGVAVGDRWDSCARLLWHCPA